MTNNQRMQDFLELTEKDIWGLMEAINIHRLRFDLDMRSEQYGVADKATRNTDLVASLIEGRPKQERESYFLSESNLFCHAVEEEEGFELAEQIKRDLDYFRHCFLEDSKYHRCPITYKALKKVVDNL